MRVLTVSDRVEKSFLKEHFLRKKCHGVRLILACGDLPTYYLEYLLNSLNVPLYYVPGNHDNRVHLLDKPFAQGCTNVDQRVIIIEALLIGGLGGAFQYRRGKYLYTEAQMERKARSMIPRMAINKIKYKRYVDILITHSPPFGIHDEQTLSHRGLKTFLKLMGRYKPAYLIHGHTRPNTGKKTSVIHYLSTKIINTYNYRLVELGDASI